MRTDLQLIQCALGIEKSEDIILRQVDSTEACNLYSADLTYQFKGFPPDWHFAVLYNLQHVETVQLYLQRIVRELTEKKYIPLVIINDNDRIVIGDLIQFDGTTVFSLDHQNLPARLQNSHLNVPLIRAIKSRLGSKRAFAKFINPYSPNKPITEHWRFFGRRKEIEQLMDSDENFFIIGGRRSGKTSLVNEFASRMRKKGHEVIEVPSQGKSTYEAYVDTLAYAVSPRNYSKIRSNAKYYGPSYFQTIISRIKPQNNKLPVLIMDEIGILLKNFNRDSWNVFGTLREYSQKGNFRVIITGFQEVLMKQYYDYTGPFVNFGNILKLNAFADHEIHEFLMAPLSYWANFSERKEFLQLIKRKVGTHPLLLQYVGVYLFQKITNSDNSESPTELLKNLLDADMKFFADAIKEVFFDLDFENDNIPIEKFLFLFLGKLAEDFNKNDVSAKIFNILDIQQDFRTQGMMLTIDETTRLIMRLELRGLVEINDDKHDEFHIAMPLVYVYVGRYHTLERLMKGYLEEALPQIPTFIKDLYGQH